MRLNFRFLGADEHRSLCHLLRVLNEKIRERSFFDQFCWATAVPKLVAHCRHWRAQTAPWLAFGGSGGGWEPRRFFRVFLHISGWKSAVISQSAIKKALVGVKKTGQCTAVFPSKKAHSGQLIASALTGLSAAPPGRCYWQPCSCLTEPVRPRSGVTLSWRTTQRGGRRWRVAIVEGRAWIKRARASRWQCHRQLLTDCCLSRLTEIPNAACDDYNPRTNPLPRLERCLTWTRSPARALR